MIPKLIFFLLTFYYCQTFCLAQEYDNFNEIFATQNCPLQPNKFICNLNSRYSEFDGSCNNLEKPWNGKAILPFKRYLPAAYDDSVSHPRSKGVFKNDLPNPRVLSRLFSANDNSFEADYTHILALFGQFLAHDFTSSPSSPGSDGKFVDCTCDNPDPNCISIAMPSDENIMRMSCMKFTRTSHASQLIDCFYIKREQLNLLTSFVDGNQIYGESLQKSQQLRLLQGGLLKSSGGAVATRPYLPLSPGDICGSGNIMTHCFMAGEGRANENLGLTSLHTLFMREHNRVATELARVNPLWDDQTLFSEARKITIAQYQHITYNEWLPSVIGRKFAFDAGLLPLTDGSHFLGYDKRVNPAIANEFAAAAFRFGHTLMRNQINRFNWNNVKIAASVNISDVIFKTVEAFNSNAGGIESILLGLINEPAAKYDTNFADTLQHHLFEFKVSESFIQAVDLLAANINRGRDHGIPSYASYRQRCGLKPLNNFDDLADVMPPEAIRKFQSAYTHVADIDLYLGGLAEQPMREGVVGPTFACIIANQFKDLKRGDRFYYENAPLQSSGPTAFTLDQLREIKKSSLARLICDDFDVVFVQKNVFKMPNQINNPKVPCQDLLKMDFSKWRQF